MSRVPRAAAAGALVCVLAGCGIRPTGVVNAGDAPRATATSLPRSQVYFVLRGMPQPVERAVAPWDTQAVFDALLAGPTAQERARGLRTELTSDVVIRAIDSRVIFVESRDRASKRAVIGYMQISCTARGLPGAPPVKMPGFPEKKLGIQADPCPSSTGPAAPPMETSPDPSGSIPAPRPSVFPGPGGGLSTAPPRRVTPDPPG
jgi:hypothetical protein